MNKYDVLRKLVELNHASDRYLDTVPSDISQFIFDNGFVNPIQISNEVLIKAYFGDQAESVFWFMQEWEPGSEVECDGVVSVINSIDDYVDWMMANE